MEATIKTAHRYWSISWNSTSLLAVLVTLVAVTPVYAGNVAVPGEGDWVDHGKIIAHGNQGEWDWRLGGAISPSSMIRLGNKYILYYVGASGERPSDLGPAFRKLGAASCEVSTDCTQASNWTKFAGNPIIAHEFPSGCEEAGIFGAAATVQGGTVYLYYGAMTGDDGGPGCTSVHTDIHLATSTDGFSFIDDPGNPVIDHADPVYGGGDEIWPDAVLFNSLDSTWYLHYGSDNWNIGVAWGSSSTNIGSGGNNKLFVDDSPSIQGISVVGTGDDYVSIRWQRPSSVDCSGPSSPTYTVQVGDMTGTDPSTLTGTRGPNSDYPYDGFPDFTLGTVFYDSSTGVWFLWHQDLCPIDPDWDDFEGKDLYLKTASLATRTAPSRLRGRARSASKVILKWRDNSLGETAFIVQMRVESGGRFRRVARLPPNTRRLVISGLMAATSYTFRVRARFGSENSGFSNRVTVMTPSQ